MQHLWSRYAKLIRDDLHDIEQPLTMIPIRRFPSSVTSDGQATPARRFRTPVKVTHALDYLGFKVSPGGRIAGSGKRHGGAIAWLAGKLIGRPDSIFGGSALHGRVVTRQPSVITFGHGHGGIPGNWFRHLKPHVEHCSEAACCDKSGMVRREP
jgi:hypothetical protein